MQHFGINLPVGFEKDHFQRINVNARILPLVVVVAVHTVGAPGADGGGVGVGYALFGAEHQHGGCGKPVWPAASPWLAASLCG